ncbi:MAG: PPC domain-containing DNA-binding protein [Aristaeellaceae bacterium]
MKTHVFRLHPGDDLRLSLAHYARTQHLGAAVILSCVGSLSHVCLRDATGVNVQEAEGEHEIVSATGTVSAERLHIHVSLSREDLSVIGGHLQEGCIIKTTAEVVLLEMDDMTFGKIFDPATGYHELDIRPGRKQAGP